jgi:hypothetical protein
MFCWVVRAGVEQRRPEQGERDVPVWTVQGAAGEDEQVEAGMLATENGVLVALSEEGLLVRAWAPGQWWTARKLDAMDPHPAGEPRRREDVLIGWPRG